MKLFVVLPCYEEEENIKRLIERIDVCTELPYSIVAVDDGSKDKTGEILDDLKSRFPLTIITHKHNMGLNKALNSGFGKAAEISDSDDLVISMDADLTHDPLYMKKMIAETSANCDIVVASRYVDGGGQKGVPTLRSMLSVGIRFLSGIVFNLQVKDATSGYRCYKAGILKEINLRYGRNLIEAKGFEASFEILVKAKRLGAKITEIPFLLDYSKKGGASKLKVFKTIFNYTHLILRLKLLR